MDTIQAIFFRVLGTRGARFFFSHLNKEAKAAMKKELQNDPNAVFIFGHTHCQEVDLENKIANGGVFTYGFAQYLIIDEKGNITMHSRRY
jgi:predicted phosphodiesterase